MKLFRYLTREVLVSTAAVSLILLLIISSGRFISYLGQVAEGKISFGFLFVILGLKLPEFIQLVIPLAFFVSLLLTYGRLYIENEMSVLFSCGISKVKLMQYSLGIALLVMILSAFFSLWLVPYSEYQSDIAKQEQAKLTVFDFIQPGKFQGRGRKTTYIEAITPEEGWMSNIFIADIEDNQGKNIPVQILASHAEQVKVADENNSTYLVLKNGTRFEGAPGSAEYRIVKFDTYAILLVDAQTTEKYNLSALPSHRLWSVDTPNEAAEWHWRLGLIIIIPILTIIAVSLSQVNPRQGRFFKILPATLLMILYLGLLIWGKGAIEKETTPVILGLWWIHGIFALIAAILFMQFNDVSLKLHRSKLIESKNRSSSKGQNI
ncbi:LPS export ABC transporter permease LptF [Marinomonas agarivorans]|nr:LPS export ABC transporter permease LptF [Marinomonas agarivorans]